MPHKNWKNLEFLPFLLHLTLRLWETVLLALWTSTPFMGELEEAKSTTDWFAGFATRELSSILLVIEDDLICLDLTFLIIALNFKNFLCLGRRNNFLDIVNNAILNLNHTTPRKSATNRGKSTLLHYSNKYVTSFLSASNFTFSYWLTTLRNNENGRHKGNDVGWNYHVRQSRDFQNSERRPRLIVYSSAAALTDFSLDLVKFEIV